MSLPANTRNPGLPTALAGLAAILLLGAVLAFLAGRSTSGLSEFEGSAELVLLSQSIPNQAARAVGGEESAFSDLKNSRERLNQLIENIDSGTGDSTSDSPWHRIRDDVDIILSSHDALMLAHDSGKAIAVLMPRMLAETANFGGSLQPGSWSGVGRHIERFELAAQRIGHDVAALTNGLGDIRMTAQRIADDLDYLGQVLSGLSDGDATLGIQPVADANARARLKTVQATYSEVSEQGRAMVTAADRLIAAQLARRQLVASGEALLRNLDSGVPLTSTEGRPLYAAPALPLSLMLAALLAVLAMLILTRTAGAPGTETRPPIVSEASDKNQRAILRLLDELGSLADGDLTVQATVTEDITGAIADSINYAIEALRELVATINDTAVMVNNAAGKTRETASHQARASETQSKQISAATDSVRRMAASIEEVSGNAERSADVARHSVDVAHKGGEAVRRTIQGMNTIRETIQDTAKRIKRLGESSQEIGNIVELINDIAEQTNVLALNASIQASMAGDAGRGFAVVADEVQRLAERSGHATKQIEVLVKTIQSDTNEAVISMDRSTTDVVGGALLAENAGAALDEIEQVSNQIAALVQNISGSARQQAMAAADISRNMGVVSEISAQSTEATSATFESISQLAELAAQLRTTVSGFRLPKDNADAVQIRPSAAAKKVTPDEEPAKEAKQGNQTPIAAGQGKGR